MDGERVKFQEKTLKYRCEAQTLKNSLCAAALPISRCSLWTVIVLSLLKEEAWESEVAADMRKQFLHTTHKYKPGSSSLDCFTITMHFPVDWKVSAWNVPLVFTHLHYVVSQCIHY